MLKSIFDSIKQTDATHDAESSFYFLKEYFFYTDWNVYSSKHYSSDVVTYLTKSFCLAHGQINLLSIEENSNSIWSINPLGVFRYRMDQNNFWQEVGYLNKINGYLVEGAYWNNGFFYQVTDNKNLIEINLFIDETTKIRYKYPETPYRTL